MDRENVLKNTVMLTASGVIAKTTDFLFRTYYTKRLGSEGAGLLSLGFTAHSIMLTLASAGLSTAIAKVVSGCLARRDTEAAGKAMRLALSATLSAAAAVIIAVFFLSGRIAEDILGDKRTKVPLIFLSPSILFMGLSYSLKGYFYSARRVLIPASSEFVEQAVKVTVISLLLSIWLPKGVEHGCRAVFLGLSIGEASSCVYLSLFYFAEAKKSLGRHKSVSQKGYAEVAAELLKISAPALVSSLAGSYLHMKEELLIVSGLKRCGSSASEALSAYGTVSGMLLPMTLFPLTLLSSFLTLLVPEISRAAARRDGLRLAELCKKVYKFASVGAFLVMTVFFSFPSEILKTAYNLDSGGGAFTVFSLLLPILLADAVSCGILNGLGRQGFLLAVTLSESLLRILICYALVPRLGISAVVLTVYCGSLFSFSVRLLGVSARAGIKYGFFEWVLLPFCLAVLSAYISRKAAMYILPSGMLALKTLLSAVCFLSLSAVFGFIKKEEVLWVKSRLFG